MHGTILIVDDNPINIQLIASVLEEYGFELEFSTSGQDAIDFMLERKFDLILMDIMMPEMSGYDACKIIKQDTRNRNVPVIFLTAKVDEDSIRTAFQVGGVDYITKPFNSDELVARVKTHIELKHSRTQLEETVKERTEELRVANNELTKANVELQKLEDAKNEFINIISHEIRTPLNGIVGPLQLLNMDIKDPKMESRLNILNDSVERLEAFSKRMILISELRSGRYKRRKSDVDMEPIFAKQVADFSHVIEQKHLRVGQNSLGNPVLKTDAHLVEQVLANLLDNSFRFSKSGGTVNVTVCNVEDETFISVEDEAGGLSEMQLEQVFKPFALEGKFVDKNVGLGLYLVKLITQWLDAQLEIENTKNGALVKVVFN